MKANASRFQALCVSKAVNPPVLELLINITNQHVPLKTRNVKPNPPPFMNSTYKKAIMNKARLQHKKSAYKIAQTSKISGYKEILLQS